MKKFFYLLAVLIPFLAIAQDKHDYFIQFNADRFSSKVSLDELFSHKAFKEFNKESSKLKLSDFTSFIDDSKKMVIHGNFTDSISYYQITLPFVGLCFGQFKFFWNFFTKKMLKRMGFKNLF